MGPKKIFVYGGPGASKSWVQQTILSFQKALQEKYEVLVLSEVAIFQESWEEKTALFVMPGGADIPYTKSLNGEGNRRIRSYVESGGCYLGICAGSYYASSFLEFAKGTSIEVSGTRELSFFAGLTRGPILSPYEYKKNSGARVTNILFEGKSVSVFYHGGGYFVEADLTNKTKILANYDLEKPLAAIIECEVGSGKAILSGVHFECDPKSLDQTDPYLKELIPDLHKGEKKQIVLLKEILKRFNLEVLS